MAFTALLEGLPDPGECSNAPWFTAPVIVGGSGGSGTRGVVLLLEALGVSMACSSHDFLEPAAAAGCDIKCNAAFDCGILSAMRANRSASGSSRGALSWLRENGTRADDACDAVDAALLADALAHESPVCGGSKGAALLRLRHSVAATHRQPLRWGMKNPHSTYYVNVLRRLFPCMVYINAVRDLGTMVRRAKHYEARVQEALAYGVLSEADAPSLALPSKRAQTAATQAFYARFLTRVNSGVDAWLSRCMAGRYVHLDVQRLVGRAREPRCFGGVVLPLLAVLRIGDGSHDDDRFSTSDPSSHPKEGTLAKSAWGRGAPADPQGRRRWTAALNATRQFVVRSLPTVAESVKETASLPPLLLPGGEAAARWPGALEVRECAGPLLVGR